MSPLRQAFCTMMANYPGPSATRYCEWAHSEEPSDARELLEYCEASARNIRRVADKHSQDRAWLPMLDALVTELKTGRQMKAEDVAALLAERKKTARSLRAMEIVDVAFGAIETKVTDVDVRLAAGAVEWLLEVP